MKYYSKGRFAKYASLAAFALTLFAVPSSITPLQFKTDLDSCGMIPANNFRFPVNPRSGQMSYAIFNAIFKKVNATMRAMPEQVSSSSIRFFPKWEDDTVNAYATVQEFETAPGVRTVQRVIVMFGGLARHPLMTVDAYALATCHEIGHHFGGYPNKPDRWAAAEGQSDYYGTAKCLRQIFASEKNAELMSRRPVDMTARLKCNHAFPNNREDAAICMRSAMAGLALANTLGSLGEVVPVIALNTPDKVTALKTNTGYPITQCRLDTYFRGALCPEPSNQPMSFENPNQGACRQQSVFDFGSRPPCWFKN